MTVIKKPDDLILFLESLVKTPLKEGGYNDAYVALHLKIAIRQYIIIENDEWKKLCEQFSAESPKDLTDLTNQSFLLIIREAAQKLLTKIEQAVEQDNIGVKLLKTGFLSTLDNAREKTQNLINILEKIDPQSTADKEFLIALKAQISYLETLEDLPFVLEKGLIALLKNKGYNYEPKKNALVLASLINTIGSAIQTEDTLKNALHIAAKISIPDLPMDGDLLTVTTEMLPFINNMITKGNSVYRLKRHALFSEKFPVMANARKILLSSAGVELDSLAELSTKTFINPYQDLMQMGGGILDIATLSEQKTYTDKLLALSDGLDKIFDVVSKNPNMYPVWLKEIEASYTNAKSATDAAVGSLGSFFNRITSLMPQPAFTANWFKFGDAVTAFWRPLLAPAEVNLKKINKEMAYLSFYELAYHAEISPSLQEEFFHSYMKKIDIKECDYSEYSAFAKDLEQYSSNLSTSLTEKINSPENHTSKYIDMLYMINTLKHEEQAFEYYKNNVVVNPPIDIKTILTSLNHSLTVIEGKEHLTGFKTQFLNPAVDRILLSYQQKNFIPLLEKTIGFVQNARIYQITQIYSKLKSDICLTSNDLDELEDFFESISTHEITQYKIIKPDILLIKELTIKRNIVDKVVNTIETPHQDLCKKIKGNIKNFEPLINAMITSLDNQRKPLVSHLKKFATINSDLDKVRKKKVAYIDSLTVMLYELKKGINERPDELARGIASLPSKLPTPQQIITQLIPFAWQMMPDGTDDYLLKNLLNYFAKDNSFVAVLKAQQEFQAAEKDYPIPELHSQLGDPLSLANLLPKQEDIMDMLVAKMFDFGADAANSWLHFAFKKIQRNIKEQLTLDKVSAFCPYPIIANIVLDVLNSEWLMEKCQPIIMSLVEQYKDTIADSTSALAQAARDRIYPLLGIEIQKALEEKALKFAADGKDINDNDRDAFAIFYLQYRAIKRQNQDIDTTACILYLFKDLKGNAEQEILKKFRELDIIYPDLKKRQDNTFEFLLENCDFSSKTQDHFITMALFNRLLMMSLEASNEEKYTQAINSLRELIKKCEPLDKASLIHEDQKLPVVDKVPTKATSQSAKIMKALIPSISLSKTKFTEQLKQTLASCKSAIQLGINDRTEMIDSDRKPGEVKFFGRSVLAVETDKSNSLRGLYKVGLILWEWASVFSTWAVIGVTLASSGGLANSALLFTGFTGPAAVALLALRILVKMTWESKQQSVAFDSIWSKDNSKWNITKVGLMLTLGLKCLLLASVKTVIGDIFFSKLSDYLALESIETVRNWFRVYPTRKVILAEKLYLENVKEAINELESNLELQDLGKIKNSFKNLNIQMGFAENKLTRGINEERKDGYNETLKDYIRKYKKITKLMTSMETIYQAESMADPDKMVTSPPISPSLPTQPKKIILQVNTEDLQKKGYIKLAKDKATEIESYANEMDALLLSFKNEKKVSYEQQVKSILEQVKKLTAEIKAAVDGSGEKERTFTLLSVIMSEADGPARTSLKQAIKTSNEITIKAESILANFCLARVKDYAALIKGSAIDVTLERQILNTPKDSDDDNHPYRSLLEAASRHKTMAESALAEANDNFAKLSSEKGTIEKMTSNEISVREAKSSVLKNYKEATTEIKKLELSFKRAADFYNVALAKVDYLTMKNILDNYPLNNKDAWSELQLELKKKIDPMYQKIISATSFLPDHLSIKTELINLLKPYFNALTGVKIPQEMDSVAASTSASR